MKKISSKSLQLIKFIESGLRQGKNKLQLFREYATQNNILYESVRNNYYGIANFLNKNIDIAKEKNINLSLLKITKITKFNDIELGNYIAQIKTLIDKNYSLRKACFMIAKNDKKLALRLQNKFRNLKSNNSNLVINSDDRIQTAQVFQMPNNVEDLITEQDMQSLFVGVLKMIKRNAYEQVKRELSKQD